MKTTEEIETYKAQIEIYKIKVDYWSEKIELSEINKLNGIFEMAKRKTCKTHKTDKQKEACKCNWVVFRLCGVIELMDCESMLDYSSDVQEQASMIKNDLEDLLDMVKEENANHKHS